MQSQPQIEIADLSLPHPPTADVASPLYITIGPQGCGKSTFIKNSLPRNVLDICLDDQPDVYVPVPTKMLLSINDSNDSNGDSTSRLKFKRYPSLLRKIHHGRTLWQRYQQDNFELQCILSRWNGFLTHDQFQKKMARHFQQGMTTSQKNALSSSLSISPQNLAQMLASTFQTLSLLEGITPPITTQIFIADNLFQIHPQTQQSGIQRAHERLATTPLHQPIAWGNTNAQPRNYQMALEIAYQYQRPVYFVVCIPPLTRRTNPPGMETNHEAFHSHEYPLPWLSLPELIQRNLIRYANTGKYIPIPAILDCYDRVEQLIANGFKEMNDLSSTCRQNDHHCPTLHYTSAGPSPLEQYLVRMASPNVPSSSLQGVPRVQYRLTSNRLVEKIQLSHSSSGKS